MYRLRTSDWNGTISFLGRCKKTHVRIVLYFPSLRQLIALYRSTRDERKTATSSSTWCLKAYLSIEIGARTVHRPVDIKFVYLSRWVTTSSFRIIVAQLSLSQRCPSYPLSIMGYISEIKHKIEDIVGWLIRLSKRVNIYPSVFYA